MIYFISDTHFFHGNVIRFDNRPFETMDQMNDEMLKKWNAKVTPSDTVYILGDYIWKTQDDKIEWAKQLNGKKRLIMGNHDFKNSSNKYKNLFESIKDYDEITIPYNSPNGLIKCQPVILSHYYHPFYNKHRHDGIHLYGHSHVTQESFEELFIQRWLNGKGYNTRAFNVGCMQPYMNYEPQTLEHIVEQGTKWKIEFFHELNGGSNVS